MGEDSEVDVIKVFGRTENAMKENETKRNGSKLAHRRNVSNALIGLVRCKQRHFQQAFEVVCSKVRIPEIVRERVEARVSAAV